MNNRNKLAFSLVIILFILSCHSKPIIMVEKKITLQVMFYNYKEKMFRFDLIDENNRIIEKWHDSVNMKIISEGIWKNKVYVIFIGEYPVRQEFLHVKNEYEIIIDHDKLLCEGNSAILPCILSGDINFK